MEEKKRMGDYLSCTTDLCILLIVNQYTVKLPTLSAEQRDCDIFEKGWYLSFLTTFNKHLCIQTLVEQKNLVNFVNAFNWQDKKD